MRGVPPAVLARYSDGEDWDPSRTRTYPIEEFGIDWGKYDVRCVLALLYLYNSPRVFSQRGNLSSDDLINTDEFLVAEYRNSSRSCAR
jgi:hypothetical protein